MAKAADVFEHVVDSLEHFADLEDPRGGIAWLQQRHNWPGLESIVMVESRRETAKTKRETRFYISSLAADAKLLGEAIRGHWGIENSLLL